MSKAPPALTVTESHQILNFLLQPVGEVIILRKCLRNYALGVFMLDAGLRVSEVARLRQGDLLFEGQPVEALLVRADIAKRRQERTIPLSTRARDAIDGMANRCWDFIQDDSVKWAFSGTTYLSHITPRQVQRIIGNAALKSIGRKIHPHILRHTFASRLMRRVNARIVQELLGHKNLTSTQIYTHPNGDDLKDAIASISEC